VCFGAGLAAWRQQTSTAKPTDNPDNKHPEETPRETPKEISTATPKAAANVNAQETPDTEGTVQEYEVATDSFSEDEEDDDQGVDDYECEGEPYEEATNPTPVTPIEEYHELDEYSNC